jgi:O-antigen/teichoic acid export membrane protein
MVKTILGTSFTKILAAILGFIIVVLNSRHLGATGLGTISLIVLAISIILIVSEIAGGGALVYLVPRYNVFSILFPAYIWTFVNIAIFSILLNYIHLVPQEYVKHVLALSLILSLSSIQSNVLIGKARINYYNITAIIQSLAAISVLIILFFVFHRVSIMSYIYSLYISYSIAYLMSLIGILNSNAIDFKSIFKAVPEMFRLGFLSQIANISQILNYRLCYYLIDDFLGRANLGKFSIGVQISESTWLIGRSIATIHYSNVSNSENYEQSRNSTILFVKFISILSTLLLLIILLLPNSLFEFVFGKDFSGIPWIIFSLSFGIIALSVNMMFSAFFSGTGKIHLNTIGSLIGLITTLGIAFILIPKYGIIGAAIANSISYCSITIYSFVVFKIETSTRFTEFIVNRKDFSKLIRSMKTLIKIG